jgi:hypothetical protein
VPKTATLQGPKPEQIKPDLTQQQKIGDNGPDDDEILFFRGRMRDVDEEIKEKRDARKRLRQAAKNRGVELKMLDWAMSIEDEDDGTTLDNLKAFRKYARALDLPIGSQLDFFDGPGAGLRGSPEALIDRAYQAGRRLGIEGRNPDSDAYPPMTEEGQAHMKGWHDGQAVNHEKFLHLNEQLAAERAAAEAKKAAKAGNGGGEGEGEEPDGDPEQPEDSPEPATTH